MTTGAVVTLREITDSNRAEVPRLAVKPEQSDFVDGVAASLEEAADTSDAWLWIRAVSFEWRARMMSTLNSLMSAADILLWVPSEVE
ncbi:MAG: hypothetical protein WKF82_02025 [Nocardioidaceae bacterium]